MGARRELTKDERRAADRFRALLLASDKTQEQIAEEIGVTQGAVWQWADGKVPISAKRAAAVARAVGVHPSEISVAWREAQVQSEPTGSQPLPVKGSHPVRPNFQKMADANFLLREYLAIVRGDPEQLFDARSLEVAYEVIEFSESSREDSNIIDLVKHLSRRLQEAGVSDGSGSGEAQAARKTTR